jgi:hypothetical protein
MERGGNGKKKPAEAGGILDKELWLAVSSNQYLGSFSGTSRWGWGCIINSLA